MNDGARLEFRVRRGKYVALASIGAAFCAVGAWMLATSIRPADRIGGGFVLLFFGACAFVVLREGLRKDPRLVIDEDGIEDRTRRPRRVHWDEIVHSDFVPSAGVPFLCLWVREPDKSRGHRLPSRSKNPFTRWRDGFGHVSISLHHLDRNAVDIAVLVHMRLQERLKKRSRG